MAVEYRREGDVAVLTLDRPGAYNAIDRELSERLVQALARAGEEARAAVLTGRGRAFCSGADLRDLAEEYEEGPPDLARVVRERFDPVARSLAAVAVPTVAAVNGPAAGAGMSLALGCDLRVMSSEAYLMSAFIKVGLIPDTGGSWHMVQAMGLSRAVEMAISGRRVGAGEAEATGLVHRVVDPEEVLSAALEWAERLAAGPTEAYVATRRLLGRAACLDLLEALGEEERTQGELGWHPAHLEGVRAFLEKREPDFRSAG